MEFGKTGNAEQPIKLTFHGDEVITVRAAFREWIYNFAIKGNQGSISDYDVLVAGWLDEPTRSVLISRYSSVTDRLDAFHEGTDDAIREIPEVTQVPVYVNKHIAERCALGSAALKLSDDIRSAFEVGTSINAIDDELARLVEKQDRT